MSRCGPLWPAVARCGPLWPAVARCGPLWPAVARCGCAAVRLCGCRAVAVPLMERLLGVHSPKEAAVSLCCLLPTDCAHVQAPLHAVEAQLWAGHDSGEPCALASVAHGPPLCDSPPTAPAPALTPASTFAPSLAPTHSPVSNPKCYTEISILQVSATGCLVSIGSLSVTTMKTHSPCTT